VHHVRPSYRPAVAPRWGALAGARARAAPGFNQTTPTSPSSALKAQLAQVLESRRAEVLMRRMARAILMAVALVWFGGSVQVASAGPRQSATGTIAHVDAAAHTITLVVNHRAETFVVSADTRLRRGPDVVDLEDLAAWNGVRAKVRYRTDGAGLTAESVMVSRDRVSSQDPPHDRSDSPPASGMTNPKRSAIR
jgi:hypothetical protein